MRKNKFLALAILLFSYLFIDGQENQEKRTDISPYNLQYDMLDFNMRTLASHEYLTQFTYFDMNFVNPRFQNFLSNILDVTQVGETEFNMSKPEKSISMNYEKKAQYNFTKPRNIIVK